MTTGQQPIVKELDLELLGIHGLNSFVSHSSASRNAMFGSHIAQRLVTCEPDSKRVVTGLENKFSNYTFDIRMPEDGKILKIIDRYRRCQLGSSGGGKRSGVVLLPLGVRLIKKAKFKFERQHAKNGAVQVGDRE